MNPDIRKPHRPHACTRCEQFVIPEGYITSADLAEIHRTQHGYPVTQQTVRNRTRAAALPARRFLRVNAQGVPLGGRPVLAWRTADIFPLFNLKPANK